jgi:pyruvate dehydrogenase E2 component (dihydrolipoamide acetyltransferase)
MSMVEVKVPDIGDFKEVEIIELLVKPGDVIKVDQSLITVESDKASMEIPASHAGVVKELKVKIGDKVAEGSLLLLLETEGAIAAAAPAAAAPVAATAAAAAVASAPAPASAPVPAPALTLVESRPPAVAQASSGAKPHASPSIRKFSRELGVDLVRVTGSGPKGRITHEDVRNYVKSVMSGEAAPVAKGAGLGLELLPWPSLDFSKFGTTELVPL